MGFTLTADSVKSKNLKIALVLVAQKLIQLVVLLRLCVHVVIVKKRGWNTMESSKRLGQVLTDLKLAIDQIDSSFKNARDLILECMRCKNT